MELAVPGVALLPFLVAGHRDGVVRRMFVLWRVDLEPGTYLLAELFGLGRVLEIHVKPLARCNQAPRRGLTCCTDAFTITMPRGMLMLARRRARLALALSRAALSFKSALTR